MKRRPATALLSKCLLCLGALLLVSQTYTFLLWAKSRVYWDKRISPNLLIHSISDPGTSSTGHGNESNSNIKWLWYRYGNATLDAQRRESSPTRRYNVLIAQYDSGTLAAASSLAAAAISSTDGMSSLSDFGSSSRKKQQQADLENSNYYNSLLTISSRINRAYSRYYAYDYVILSGLAFVTPRDMRVVRHSTGRAVDQPRPQLAPSRATYNKIVVLEQALKWNRQYDAILLLDADAMLYDFSRDIATLLPRTKMLVAHLVAPKTSKAPLGRSNGTATVYDSTSSSSTDINIGVTLWNLHHPLMASTVKAWRTECTRRLDYRYWWTPYRTDDQAVLQRILQDMQYQRYAQNGHGVLAWLGSFFRDRTNTQTPDHDNPVHAIPFEFDYKKGRMVKHFIRSAHRAWNVNGAVEMTAGDATATRVVVHNLTAASATRVQLMTETTREICKRYTTGTGSTSTGSTTTTATSVCDGL